MTADLRDPLEADLLAVVVARPDDDLPRLVYADYLAERGDPRAELIRVQLELADSCGDDEPPAGRPDDERRSQLRNREGDLLDELGDDLLTPSLDGVKAYRVARGFLTGLDGPASALDRVEPAELACVPLEDLVAYLDGDDAIDALVRVIGRAPWRRIALRGPLYYRGAVAVADALAQRPELTELTLDSTAVTDEGVARILTESVRTRLTALSLRDDSLWRRTHHAEFMREIDLPALTHLDVSRLVPQDVIASSLVAWPGLRRLTRLDLDWKNVSVSTLDRLLNSPFLGPDTRFRVEDGHARRLARAGLLSSGRFVVADPFWRRPGWRAPRPVHREP